MFNGVYIAGKEVSTMSLNGNVIYSKQPAASPLCFTAQQANSTVGMTTVGTAPTITLQTSRNNRTWTDWDFSTITLENVGDKLYVRSGSSGNDRMANSENNNNLFVLGGLISASGNLNSLLSQDFTSITSLSGRDYCYVCLFKNCSALTTPPELPATTLSKGCYSWMFGYCTSLTTPPELPATTLTDSCYAGMFVQCESMTSTPELPATYVPNNAYHKLFQYCSSIESVHIQATSFQFTADWNCAFPWMFQGCTSLSSIKVDFTGNINFRDWVTNVASSGDFYYNGSTTSRGGNYIPDNWTIRRFGPTYEPLCFTALEANSTVAMEAVGSAPSVTLQYSTDKETWNDWDMSAITLANVGDKVYFRNKSSGATGSSASNYNHFVMTGKFNASNNINSIYSKDYSGTIPNYGLYGLFKGCDSLISAKDAVIGTSVGINNDCYHALFQNCTSLTHGPEIPNFTLSTKWGAFGDFYNGCTSLVEGKINVTSLATGYGFYGFFSGCSQLNHIIVKFTNWNGTEQFTNWVSGVAETGVFECPAGLTEQRGVNRIPDNWTIVYN